MVGYSREYAPALPAAVPVRTVVRPTWNCRRRGHTWVPRIAEEPQRCPWCASPFWNRPPLRLLSAPKIRPNEISPDSRSAPYLGGGTERVPHLAARNAFTVPPDRSGLVKGDGVRPPWMLWALDARCPGVGSRVGVEANPQSIAGNHIVRGLERLRTVPFVTAGSTRPPPRGSNSRLGGPRRRRSLRRDFRQT
jgi:hypothetical protein